MVEEQETTRDTEPGARDRILHIADVHFWRVVRNPFRLLNKRFLGNLNVFLRRRHEFLAHRAEDYADALAATGIKTAILTGDFTSTALDEEFVLAKTFVDRLAADGMTIHLMPGNHDVYTFESHRTRRFESYFKDYLPEEGYPAKVRLPGGTDLVLISTVVPNMISSKGLVTRQAVEKTSELLAACGEPVLTAGHYPVLNETYGYTMSSDRQMRNAGMLHRALGEAGKRMLYLSGHVHRFTYVQDPDYPNLTHLTTGGFFHHRESDGSEGEFSEIHVKDEGFIIYRHVFQKGWDRKEMAVRDLRG